MMETIHFIAVGGSAMHSLAIALHKKGYHITGSDDEIFEPSRGRLEKYGLLPPEWGWFPEKLSAETSAVILGMHARADNPELKKAQELGLKIYSYPEFLYEQTKNKIRVVIGGSHGKTTVTSMIMHVLKETGIPFDYMVGSQAEGFEIMAGFNEESKIAVFEGDEYLSSPIDRRPKFHLYKPHIGLLTGIAWDHINVFPTFENYTEQFAVFASLIEPGGTLVYFSGDEILCRIARSANGIKTREYHTPAFRIENGTTLLQTGNTETALSVFGLHNLQNIAGAKIVCGELGVSDDNFYQAIGSFKGASRRLEVLAHNDTSVVFQDFAHSPSKLKATVEAVRQQFPEKRLVACMELHTFSSLKKEFLPQYRGSMEKADSACVYFNPHTIAHKKLEPIAEEQVFQAFGKEGLKVYTDSGKLFRELAASNPSGTALLLMSSGNFDGIDLKKFSTTFIENQQTEESF